MAKGAPTAWAAGSVLLTLVEMSVGMAAIPG
jgi:hypothetical protein